MSMNESSSPRPAPGPTEYALLLALGLTWGTSYMFTKIAVSQIAPFSLVAIRTSVAALALLPLMGLRHAGTRITRRDWACFALVGLVTNALPLSLVALSVSYVDSSVVATTMALVPLITLCLAMIGGEYPSLRNVVGIFIGLAGIAILFGPAAFVSFGDSAKGALAAVGASVVFSSSLFAMGLVRHHGSMRVATLSLTAAACWSILIARTFEGVPQALPGGRVMAAALVLALFNTAGANLLLFALVPRAGASFTSINNYLVPAIAVVCGAVFLGEPLTLQSVSGVAVVLAGVAVSTYRRRPLPPAPPPA